MSRTVDSPLFFALCVCSSLCVGAVDVGAIEAEHTAVEKAQQAATLAMHQWGKAQLAVAKAMADASISPGDLVALQEAERQASEAMQNTSMAVAVAMQAVEDRSAMQSVSPAARCASESGTPKTGSSSGGGSSGAEESDGEDGGNRDRNDPSASRSSTGFRIQSSSALFLSTEQQQKKK